jgi:hypothetical protein
MCLVNFPASFCTTLIAESSAGDFANNSSNQNTASAEKHIKNNKAMHREHGPFAQEKLSGRKIPRVALSM